MFFFFKFFLISFVLLKINFCIQNNSSKTKLLNDNNLKVFKNERIKEENFYVKKLNKSLENKSVKNKMVEPIILEKKINYTKKFLNPLIDSIDNLNEENFEIDKKSNKIIKDVNANNNQYSNSTTKNLFEKANKKFLNDASQNNDLKEKKILINRKNSTNDFLRKKNSFLNNSQVKRKKFFSNSDLEKNFSKNVLFNSNLNLEKLFNLSKTTIPNHLKNFSYLINKGTTAIVSKKSKHEKRDKKKTTKPFLETTTLANLNIIFLDTNTTKLNNKNISLLNSQTEFQFNNFSIPLLNSSINPITESSIILETNTIKPLNENEQYFFNSTNPYIKITFYPKTSTSSYIDTMYPYFKNLSLTYDKSNSLTTTEKNFLVQNLSNFYNLYATSKYSELTTELIENKTISKTTFLPLAMTTEYSKKEIEYFEKTTDFPISTSEYLEGSIVQSEKNTNFLDTTKKYSETTTFKDSINSTINLTTEEIKNPETTALDLSDTKKTKLEHTKSFDETTINGLETSTQYYNKNTSNDKKKTETNFKTSTIATTEITQSLTHTTPDLKTTIIKAKPTTQLSETTAQTLKTTIENFKTSTSYLESTTPFSEFTATNKSYTNKLQNTTELYFTTNTPTTTNNQTFLITTTNPEFDQTTQSPLTPNDSIENTTNSFFDEDLQNKLREVNYTLKFDPIGSDVLLIFENFTIPAKSELLANYTQIKYEANLYLVKYKFYNRLFKEKLENISFSYDPQKGFLVLYDFLIKIIDANVNTMECEIVYTLDNKNYKSINQIFTLILTNEKNMLDSNDFISSYFYKLYSSNSTVVKAKVNDTIKLECFAVTYKRAPSKNGFIWRKRTLNKDWDFKKYQDSKQMYQASELLFRNSMNDTLLEFKVIRTQLIISNIDLLDTGYHYCEYDSDSVRKSHGIYVEVLNIKTNDQNTIEDNSFVSFESEHGTTNPLVIKFKETFHLRVKLNFNEVCNVTILWIRKMKHILAKPVVINGILGLSNTVFHTIDSAEIKDSGDYALLVIKNLSPDSKLLLDIQKYFINSYLKKNSNDISLIQANLYNNLKGHEINIKTLIVKVEGSVELSLFKSEKFYLNNYYSAVCHVFSTVPTVLHWLWSDCKTDEECDQNPESWKPIHDSNLNKLLQNKNLSSKDFSGNNETLFKMIALNNEQINVLDFKFQKEVSYACVSESSFGKSNVTFRTIASEVDLSISANEKKIFTNDNLTLKCEGIFHQKPILVWLYQKNETSPSVVLAEKTTKNYFISYTNEKKELEEFQHEYIRDYLEFIRYKNYYFSESKLFIQGLQSNQNGLYHCKNEINNKESALHLLTVQTLVMPKIKSFDRINLTSKIILICKYIGNPEPRVNWYKDGEFFNITVVSDAFESKIVLDLETIKTEESFYGCEVLNRWGKDRKNILVQFKNQKNNPKKDEKNQNNEKDQNSKPNTKEKQTSTRDSISINYFFVSFIVLATILIFFTVYKRKFTFNKTNTFFVKKKKPKKNLGFAFYNNSAYENELSDIINASNNNFQLNKLLKSIEFTEDRLDLGRVIGQGAYGIVVKAEAIGIEKSIKITTVAVKMLKDQYSIEQRNSLISEVHTLLVLGKHLNIVNLLGIVTKSKLMVIVEYCRYGNIKNFLFSNRSNFINMVMKNGELEITHEDAKNENSNSSIDSGFSIKTPLKTLDLINFIFQISRGMQYIHSKKLLHRDLAARNVLLADDFVVKICDFGLSEDVYFDSDYIKKGHAKLPIKWMAYESIVDQLFTTKSDVWSFAVVCWEIFTMGSDPYPGIPTDEHFHKKLKEGYRMERTEQCPKEIYEIMTKCWHKEPEERPTFEELSISLYEILDSSTRNCYVDVNIS